jgi:type IV pilus assembly protein PilC
MPQYEWEATNRNGEYRSGVMESDDEAGVRSRLTGQGLIVTNVKKKARELSLPTIGSGVALRDLVIFTRTFSTMIDAGLPIVQCLDMLGAQTENRLFGKALMEIKDGVESGKSLSDSMGLHPKIFDELFRNLVAAGEAGGILDLIFRRLAVYLEKADKLRRQVKGAMIYPSAITVVGILVMGVMMTFVLPTFERMFKELGAGALPAPTRVVLAMSHFTIDNLHFIIGGMILLAVGFVSMIRNEKGRLIWHHVLLRMPVIGPVIRKGAVARFTRTLGTLLSSGVPILEALEIVAKTSGNEVIKRGILDAREKVAEGKDLATPLMATAIFPPMVVQMIGVGERTGAMDEMLQKIADFYEDEVDQAVAAMTALIEPIILVGLGGGVGGMLIAMYLPIFEIAGGIK